jgi:transcriptional regulator with XRE-family HTH domain/KaiC/GvpD/RAD55 family RecA-like ATPase
MVKKDGVSSGVPSLDLLLDGLHIGDNVVWHDDAGSLASVFCLNFVQASQAQERPLIYVTFDRSPKNLLDKLGSLGNHPGLIILDCFTHGKGAGSDVFLKFYGGPGLESGPRVVLVDEPRDPEAVMRSLYGIHGELEGDVRFVFESLTGMQELWGGEEQVLGFYSHSCPRLYELNTIAYWILEKRAHSTRLRAQINQIAQVALEMSVKRGTTFLTVLKAENRDLDTLNKPHRFWSRDLRVTFDPERGTTGRLDLGKRLKTFRSKRGLNQKELAERVGVTPSTISQIESNLIYPSLPALLKMSEVLDVPVSSFFQDSGETRREVVFPGTDATETALPGGVEGRIGARLLTPLDLESDAEIYLIEIPPKQGIPSHFLVHKGEEFGYVLTGKLRLKMTHGVFTASGGDVIHLAAESPLQWKNTGSRPARILWIKLR